MEAGGRKADRKGHHLNFNLKGVTKKARLSHEEERVRERHSGHRERTACAKALR